MPDGAGSISIKLGARDYEVVPQGIGRIKRKVGALLGLAGGSSALDGEIDEQLYDVLKTFIPDLAELHTLQGYSSAEALQTGSEPDGGIVEVTLPQILDAIETIYTINGADRLVRLGKGLGLDADLIRSLVNKEVANWALQRSPSSPAPSGESDSESSIEPSPTVTVTNDPPSPSRDSSTSSRLETPVAA